MKFLITSIVFSMLFAVSLTAQLTIDDFASGNMGTKAFNNGESEKMFQAGTSIVGKMRRVHLSVGENIYNQKPQLTVGVNNQLAYSSGYNVSSSIYLAYGYNEKGAKQLNLDWSKYTKFKIEFDARSTQAGMHLAVFTNSDRAVYGGLVPAREGKMVFEIPLSELQKIGTNFTLTDIDHIVLQFDSRSKTGLNMAINKIWLE